MAASPLQDLVGQLAEWLDAALAVGWRGMSQSHRSAGERIAHRLEDAGLSQCADAMARTLATPDADAAVAVGRLAIVLEMTREALEIERFRGESAANVG